MNLSLQVYITQKLIIYEMFGSLNTKPAYRSKFTNLFISQLPACSLKPLVFPAPLTIHEYLDPSAFRAKARVLHTDKQ